jgi:hypothetical protein
MSVPIALFTIIERGESRVKISNEIIAAISKVVDEVKKIAENPDASQAQIDLIRQSISSQLDQCLPNPARSRLENALKLLSLYEESRGGRYWASECGRFFHHFKCPAIYAKRTWKPRAWRSREEISLPTGCQICSKWKDPRKSIEDEDTL